MKIKNESLLSRCEVCHQSDCFDSNTNYCSRCEKIATQSNEDEKVLKIDFSIEFKDMLNVSYWLYFSNVLNKIVLLLGFLVLVFHMVVFYLYPNLNLSFHITVIGFILCMINLPAIYFNNWIKYKKFKENERNNSFIFSNKEFRFGNDQTFCAISWDIIEEVIEIENYFIIIIDKTVPLILPKRVLQSKDDISYLKSILQANLGNKFITNKKLI